jgi:dUTP pyrophosphatase
MPNINFKQLTATAKCPTRADEGSAGFDLYSDAEVFLQPGEFKMVPLGFSTSFPEYMVGQVCPRSGMAAKYGVTVLNAPGIIDSSFRGEWKVILINLSQSNFHVHPGDRVAQVVFGLLETAMVWAQRETLDLTARGSGGFGSTGQ